MSPNSNYTVFNVFFLLHITRKKRHRREMFRYYQFQVRAIIKVSRIYGTRMCVRFSHLALGALYFYPLKLFRCVSKTAALGGLFQRIHLLIVIIIDTLKGINGETIPNSLFKNGNNTWLLIKH